MYRIAESQGMHDSRPPLNRSLSVDEFRHYYWLKDELVAFCREQGISRAGSKLEIQSPAGGIPCHRQGRR